MAIQSQMNTNTNNTTINTPVMKPDFKKFNKIQNTKKYKKFI
jgi:hypothetical protein